MIGRMRPFVSKVSRLIVVTSLGGVVPSAAVAQTIIWTDTNAGRIQGKDVNGGAIQTLVQFPSNQAAVEIQYDPVSAKLYYVFAPASGPSVFQRINPDGSEVETISTPSAGIFAINVELRRLYWIVGYDDVLNFSSLDGSGVATHTYPACCLFCMEGIDDDLFFGAGGMLNKGVWRADPDGGNEVYFQEPGFGIGPVDFTYDPVEDKLYAGGQGGIRRMNRDGTGYGVLFNQFDVTRVEVDYRGRKIYWTLGQDIQRSNLDGSGVEDFVTRNDVENPFIDIGGLTIVYSTVPIPTTSVWTLIAMGAVIFLAGCVVLKKRLKTAHELILPIKEG